MLINQLAGFLADQLHYFADNELPVVVKLSYDEGAALFNVLSAEHDKENGCIVLHIEDMDGESSCFRDLG